VASGLVTVVGDDGDDDNNNNTNNLTNITSFQPRIIGTTTITKHTVPINMAIFFFQRGNHLEDQREDGMITDIKWGPATLHWEDERNNKIDDENVSSSTIFLTSSSILPSQPPRDFLSLAA
jgi:hypothetical protein